MHTDRELIQYLMWYIHNETAINVVRAIFGEDSHPDYVAEKTATLKHGLTYFWGALDATHQQRLLDLAFAAYKKEVV